MTPVKANSTHPAVFALLYVHRHYYCSRWRGIEYRGCAAAEAQFHLLLTLARLLATLPVSITIIRRLTGMKATPNPAITPLVL
jgi:hypothetical protein